MVPQTPTIPEGMTVREYVLLGRTPYISYWGSESADDVAKVTTILGRLDLDQLDHRPMQALSGGERQRAVLARALAQEAGLLLLDEPTAALDLGHQQQVLDHVDELRRSSGIGVLSALHDLTLAAHYADRLVLIDNGLVAASGPASGAPSRQLNQRRGDSASGCGSSAAMAGKAYGSQPRCGQTRTPARWAIA